MWLLNRNQIWTVDSLESTHWTGSNLGPTDPIRVFLDATYALQLNCWFDSRSNSRTQFRTLLVEPIGLILKRKITKENRKFLSFIWQSIHTEFRWLNILYFYIGSSTLTDSAITCISLLLRCLCRSEIPSTPQTAVSYVVCMISVFCPELMLANSIDFQSAAMQLLLHLWLQNQCTWSGIKINPISNNLYNAVKSRIQCQFAESSRCHLS